MKKCTNCGREHPDSVECCPEDHEPLTDGQRERLAGIPPLLAAAPPSACTWSERQIRVLELVLVCFVAFSGAILTSSHSFFFGETPSTGSGGAYRWFYSSVREVTALGVLWYVLLRHGKSFANLGLSWKVLDFFWSIALYLAGSVAFKVVYDGIYYCGFTSISRGASSQHVGHILFSEGVFATTFMFQFLNPFFEELIARAYVMTEVKFLTNSLPLAIIVSTVIQTSYHFYQGAPAALGHGATFLLFSIYYAKTNRITPIILAHMYFDVLSTVGYAFSRSS